jgi:hypothetical protein
MRELYRGAGRDARGNYDRDWNNERAMSWAAGYAPSAVSGTCFGSGGWL